MWVRLREPRVVSAIYAAVYTLYLGIGIGVLTWPPGDLATLLGAGMMTATSVLAILGGSIGLAGALSGAWWAERSALWLLIGATLTYAVVVLWVWPTDTGETIIRVGMSLIAALMLAARLIHVQGLYLDPDRKR